MVFTFVHLIFESAYPYICSLHLLMWSFDLFTWSLNPLICSLNSPMRPLVPLMRSLDPFMWPCNLFMWSCNVYVWSLNFLMFSLNPFMESDDFLALQSSALRLGAYSNPSHPSTFSFWAFKPVLYKKISCAIFVKSRCFEDDSFSV